MIGRVRRRAPHDVAIYTPWASIFYGREAGHAGGAELQTFMLARELTRRGLRTAHVVFPLEGGPGDLPPPVPTIVERPGYPGHGPIVGAALEAMAIWRGLWRANARCYVVRGSGGHLAAAAKFCKLYRRHLVFSSSNDVDFDFDRPDRRRHVMRSYREGIAGADRIVVQTSEQLALARAAFPTVESALIPSFAEPADPAPANGGGAFLWADRLVPYKRPEEYLDLAEALPEARFSMIMQETDETHWYPDLVERVHRRGEQLPNVDVLAALPRAQLLDLVSRAVAVVKTSEVEGMPNTFLEAWARGVPVLTLNIDPGERIAEHGVGLLADGSQERFAELARRLWTEPALRTEIGERGRAFVRSTHAPDVVADKWVALLTDVIREDQPRDRSG